MMMISDYDDYNFNLMIHDGNKTGNAKQLELIRQVISKREGNLLRTPIICELLRITYLINCKTIISIWQRRKFNFLNKDVFYRKLDISMEGLEYKSKVRVKCGL